MRIKIDKKYLFWGITAFLVVGASILLAYFIFNGNRISSGFDTIVTVAMPILYGMILAYLFTPLVNGFEKKLFFPLMKKYNKELTKKSKKRIRLVSILLTLVVVISVVYAFFAMVIPQLLNSIQSIIEQFPRYIENLEAFITKILSNNPDIYEAINNVLENYSNQLTNWFEGTLIPQANSIIQSLSKSVLGSVLGVLKALWNLVIGLIISIYLLGSKEKFCGQAKKMAYAFFDRKTANSIISDFRFAHKTFGGFIVGKIIDSLLIGLICFSCVSLMNMPYTVLISVIVGVTNVIPFFGPFFGAVPCSFLILLVDPVKCIYFIIFIIILQQFDGNFLGPKILGDSTGLASFWVIFSITIFGGLFGVFGMVVGVPIFAIFYAFVKKTTNKYLKKKGLPISTEQYVRLDIISSGNVFCEMKSEETALKKDNETTEDVADESDANETKHNEIDEKEVEEKEVEEKEDIALTDNKTNGERTYDLTHLPEKEDLNDMNDK